MTTLFTSELALVLFTILGLAVTGVAIARDVGPRRVGDGPVMTLGMPARTLLS